MRKRENTVHRGAFILAAAVVFALLLFLPVRSEAKVRAPKMDCHAYVVMDAGSGQVLFGQKANKKIYPASTTKLMTAIVCVENGDVNGTIKTRSEIVNGTTPGTYSLGIASDVTFTFKDLLHVSLMSSAADATDSLAAGVFGSKKACVEAMNEKCSELGLKKTHFDNPVGSDIGAGFEETYSTATEMAQICRYAMSVPLIRSTVGKTHYTTTRGQNLNITTTNWFLTGQSYYDADRYRIIGSKTGTTDAAGNVFIATAVDREGHEVICAYFGTVSKESTFTSIRRLLDYTFDQYEEGAILLTPSNYDVRCTKKWSGLYEEYASLGCYPGDSDCQFHPNSAITRKELGKLMRGVDNLSGNAVITRFVQGNKQGTVTVARLARLLTDLYPAHRSEEAVSEILGGCSHTENLSEEDREACAVLIDSGLAVDDAFYDAAHRVTRKEALLFADALSDYQVGYCASHVVYTLESGREDSKEASDDEGKKQEERAYPALPCGDFVSGLNKKWMDRLTEQAAAMAQAD